MTTTAFRGSATNPTSKTWARGFGRCHFRAARIELWLIFSLAVGFAACQTSNLEQASEKPSAILASQLLVVRGQLEEGKPDAALASLRVLVREYPRSAPVENMMGLAHLSLHNPARAVRHFATAYKIDGSPATALNLSSAYIESGEFDKAIALLMPLTKSVKGQAYEHKERLFHNLGYCYARKASLGHAADWLRAAVEENPTFFPSYLELARIYEKTNRPALAIKTYRQATDHCLACFEPVYALSMLYMQTQRPTEARRTLLRFTKEDGISPRDRQEAMRLLRIVAASDGGKAERAPRRQAAGQNQPPPPKRS